MCIVVCECRCVWCVFWCGVLSLALCDVLVCYVVMCCVVLACGVSVFVRVRVVVCWRVCCVLMWCVVCGLFCVEYRVVV